MTAIKEEAKKIFDEKLKDFPEDKISSLLDYMEFLKNKSKKQSKDIPNDETIKALNDIKNKKNLVYCKDADDMFKKLGI